MKVKTHLKAGAPGGAGEPTPDAALQAAAEQGARLALESSGLTALGEQLDGLPQRWAETAGGITNLNQLETPEWWGRSESFNIGVPAVVRPIIQARISSVFHGLVGEDEVFPGQNFARTVRCYYLAAVSAKKGTHQTAAQWAKQLHGESHIVTQELGKMERSGVEDDALVSDRVEGIGVTFPENFLPGFIELARQRSVFLAATPVQVPLVAGKLTLLVQTEGASFGWVERETDEPPRTGLKFASRAMTSKILKGIIVWSQIAMRRSTVLTDAMVLQDMLSGAASAIDDAALLGNGDGGEPKGVRNLIDAAHVIDATELEGDMTDADRIRVVQHDLRRAKVPMWKTGVDPIRPTYFTSSRDHDFFLTHRTNDGAPAWPSVERSGALHTWPMFHSTKIGINGDPDGIGSTLIGVDMAQMLFGEEQGVTIEISLEATVTDDDGEPFSLWARSAGGALLTFLGDLDMARRKLGFVLKKLNWGGADPVVP